MHVINEDMPQGFDKEISVMPYEDAKSIYDDHKAGNIKFKTDFRNALQEDSIGKQALAGFQQLGQSVERIPESARLLWGETQVAVSNIPDWLRGAGATPSEELRKTGAMNIRTANRNLEALMARQESERIRLKDQKNFTTMAANVGGQYGVALSLGLVPVVGPALSLGYIVSQTATGTALEGLEQYKQEHPEDKELNGFIDEKVTKEVLLNAGKTFANAVGEYILGAPAQIRRAKRMADLAKRGFQPQRFGALRYVAKNAAIGAAQEFTEEGLIQGSTDTLFDYLLGRYKDKDEAVKAWKENLNDSLYAGMFGGAFGMAGAINARARGIQATRELLQNVVPEKDLDRVATVVFENELKEARDVATVALEINSQLNSQKGEIYDALRNAAFQAAKESGGYKGLTDESLWSHINEVSERFAQEAVAEAFKRNVPIQEVIESNDIVYKDGELHLAKAEGDSNLGKKIGEAIQQSKMNKEQEDLAQTMYQLDQNNPEYTGETLNINGVDKTVYNTNGDRIAKSEDALRAFYNWFGDSKVVDEQGRPVVMWHATNKTFDTFNMRKVSGYGKAFGFGQYFTNNEEASEEYGEIKMPVYLSLKNPLIIKENVDDVFNAFEEIGLDKEEMKKKYEDYQDPFKITESIFEYEDASKKIRKRGYDGIIYNNGEINVAYKPNQIKSTENKGTWSNEKNNIYEQSAYAGSRVDYEKPSLEAIGTGEGNQAHGYGLYTALNKSVAERYREQFTNGNRGIVYLGDKMIPPAIAHEIGGHQLYLAENGDLSELKENIRMIVNHFLDGNMWEKQRIDEGQKLIKYIDENENLSVSALQKYIKENTNNKYTWETVIKYAREDAKKSGKKTNAEQVKQAIMKHIAPFIEEDTKRRNAAQELLSATDESFSNMQLKYEKGQVHEFEIPEPLYLLDEQKTISEQSSFVKKQLKAVAKEAGISYDSKLDIGKQIYDKLSYTLGSAKAASEILEKNGIKGITYDGRRDGRCFVIFNPEDMKVIQKFYQVQGLGKNKPVQRGSFNANSKVIQLFENANTSTLPHELAHYWLDNMWNYANSGNASPQYVAQFNAVKEFLGVKPEQENLTRAQHEKFASAYEKYLYRGEFPKPIIGVVFDNYERFIRDVYQSINDIRAQGKSKVRLTPEIIQFFDSMVSGELPTMAENANVVNEARAEEVHQYDSKIVEEVKKEIQVPVEAPVQATTPQEILPVGSSGEIAESRFAKRSEIATGIETSMQYERANMEKERQKAADMWKNDPQKAQAELNNATIGNDVLRSALYTEQQRIALENGDTQTYLKSVRKQSAEATRAGQEIAALRGVMEDITMPTYWIRLAEWEAQKQLAKNMATYFDKVMGNTPLMNFTQKFDADVKALYEKVKGAKTNAEKSQIMKDGLEQMKKTYRGLNQQELGTLYQTDWTNEELAYDYVEKKARDAIGLNLTNEKANAIIQASRDLDKLSRKVDAFGIPTSEFFAKKSELEYMINSHTPSSQTKVLLSTLGRANMLTAPATSVLNVASNVQNFGAQKIVRMLNNKITGHTNENLVDPNLQKQYRKRVWDTFWATGYDLAMMNDITDTRLYRGESAVNSAGEGVIRQAGQWAEKHIFGELISSPDMVFKSYLAFTDFAGNEATDVALKEGLSGDKAKKRANDLFTDAVRIEPQTEIGKQIRAKAQADALVITFQQDTRLARTLLDLRNLVNKATGDIGVGDLLSAFVKTPANVLALGYDATVGPFGHLINTWGAIQDARAGNLNSARVMATLRQTTTMAVMQALVAAFALGFIDDDDYIPDYSQLSPSERLIVKERGGSFGSIRIGDTYISTDFFGPFELPLTAWLNARRQDGFLQSASAYIGSVIRKGMDAPVIKDLMDQAKAAEEVGSDSLSIWEHIYDTAGNLLISRLTPNVMNTLAKMSDDYERETNRKVLNKLISRVPGLRQTLPPKMSVSTGKPIETPNAFLQLFFGARAHRKVDSAVADELYRLYQQGERATISDITRSGDLKLIDEKDKQAAKEWFAREYSSAASKVIKSADYRSKSDEEKKNVLNKIRRDLVKQLKEKHKNKISVAKQKK